MNENLFKPIRAASERRLARKSGKSLLNINFVTAATRGRAFRSSLPSELPVKVSSSKSVCDEEENSDLESSSSTLSVEESENSPPQSQVTLKRTISVVVEQEDPRGQFPPKLQFRFLTPTTPFKLFLVYFLPLFMFADWDVQRVKAWVKALFNDEDIARKFEEEEIERETLQSERILSDSAMNSLGLSTIGKKNKFAIAIKKLFGKSLRVTLIQSVLLNKFILSLLHVPKF